MYIRFPFVFINHGWKLRANFSIRIQIEQSWPVLETPSHSQLQKAE